MANVNLPKQMQTATTDELLNAYNKLIKEMTFLLNHLDHKNISVGGITADSIRAGAIDADKIAAGAITAEKIAAGAIDADMIDVDELSAITANLGFITAGIITGVLIQTAFGGQYPRIELNNNNNILEAQATAADSISISAFYFSNLPAIRFINGSDLLYWVYDDGLGNYTFISNTGITFNPTGNLTLRPSSLVRFENWSKVYNDDNSESLKDALDDIWGQIALLNSRVTALENDSP